MFRKEVQYTGHHQPCIGKLSNNYKGYFILYGILDELWRLLVKISIKFDFIYIYMYFHYIYVLYQDVFSA